MKKGKKLFQGVKDKIKETLFIVGILCVVFFVYVFMFFDWIFKKLFHKKDTWFSKFLNGD